MRGKAAREKHELEQLKKEAEGLVSFIAQLQDTIKDTEEMTTSEVRFLKRGADKAQKRLKFVRKKIAQKSQLGLF